MKIAIIAPSPIPFTIGGAEKLWFGMQQYINRYTNHQCELIKVPIKENSFWNLIESYYKFYRLDLSHFDMVISGKYPAWLVQHKNHHLYMLHPLRGLYDSYPFNKNIDNPQIKNFLKELKDKSLGRIFKDLFELREQNLPSNIFDFPAPFIREIIHILDKKAFKNIRSFWAISQTIINREDYFLKGSKVECIYPPSSLEEFKNREYSYFFTASRLDTPKRVDLIIEAYKKSNSNIPLKIAGVGKEYNRLKKLIGENKNIELLGFISDEELIDYYASSYAVIFIPKDEDYGLITIEAMFSQKCVITCSDSGGVLEFVKHKKTGLISSPTTKELAKNIDFLSKNRDLALKMGESAKRRVSNISWKNSINRLLKSPSHFTVVSTYPIYPPMGGGQNRLFYLFKELAKSANITIISLVSSTLKQTRKEIAPNLYEIQVPKTKKHETIEANLSKKSGTIITDIAFIYLYKMTPKFIDEVKRASKVSDFILSSPYTYPLLKKYTQTPIVYESQNIEYLLKKSILKRSSLNKKFLNKLFTIENELLNSSIFTTACADEDIVGFKKLYGIDFKSILISNGVDLESVNYYSNRRRAKIKSKTKYIDKKIVLFIGSEHYPNIEAVYKIIELAKQNSGYLFIIIGGVYRPFENIETPSNIKFTKFITNEEKDFYLSITDIAINPILSGSGSNLKILDYLASGTPLISTPFGARGFNLPKRAIIKVDISDFSKYFKNIDYLVDTKRARNFIVKNYSWVNIAKKLKEKIIK